MANEDRLISANKLMDAINFEYDLNYGESLIDPARFADMVDDAPSVDAVEVVHGRWIHDYNNLYGCSECMERETMSPKKLKNYCPNCGAKMDGDGNG